MLSPSDNGNAGSHLISLRRQLALITSFFDSSRRCIYIDYPVHTNIGDQLINLGTEQFFADHNLYVWRRYNYYDFPKEIPGIRRDDVLFFHGGGNFGDLWFNNQRFREAILDRYPFNRVIFLPQTVHFKDSARAAASIRRMAAHKNLHVFARDHVSLDVLTKGGLKCVSAMPDMAQALAGVLEPSHEGEAGAALQLVRRDLESFDAPPGLIHSDCPSIDWDHGTFSGVRQMFFHTIANTVKVVGRYGPPVDLHRLWYWHRDNMVADGVRWFSRYKTVATNRLHAMLLGIFLGRNVVAWDNNYGKLSAYYDSWLRDIPNLVFHRTASSEMGAARVQSVGAD
ncbi:MAG: polysaccharide pyruvyl transferase family protein [Candidatus Acidiferrales bacterium]